MDEDTVFAICAFSALILLPIGIVFSVFVISAAVSTRQWQKKKALRFQNADISEPLVSDKSGDADSDSDLETLDSDDEAEKQDIQDAKREEEADWQLTTKEKFWKELALFFNGKSKKHMERVRKMKEKEDRRKLAKDVVKVMRRVERRQARFERRAARAGASSGVDLGKEDLLPSYKQ